jgi:hypothetical protein
MKRRKESCPPILDWVSGEFTQPHEGDGRKLSTIAMSIARQFKTKAKRPGQSKRSEHNGHHPKR